jgi:hypothetical protein
MGYRCSVCGQVHDDLPHVGFDRPDYAHHVPEAERDERVRLDADFCTIDDTYFFIRGVVEIPVHDHDEGFAFGVWVSQKEENFHRYRTRPDAAGLPPTFGWFSNEIACYDAPTLELKTRVHFRGGALRPAIALEPTDHPLAVDQRQGISLERAWEIVHRFSGG